MDRLEEATVVAHTEKPSAAERFGGAWGRIVAWAGTPAGRVWVDAAQIWLATRASFLMLTYLIPALLKRDGFAFSLLGPLHAWITGDGTHYYNIAHNGYSAPWLTNFWPLYPTLGGLLGPIFGGDDALSLLFVSNLACFGAFVALRRLAEREFGPDAAYRATLYLAAFPTALYLFAPYTESLFLFLAITSFALLRERRWWLAGLFGGLAALTRSAGVLLLAPFAVEFFLAWRAGRTRWYQAFAALLMPAGVAVYSGYLYTRFGDPLAFSHAGVYDWRHNLTLPWQIPGLVISGLGKLGGVGQVAAAHFLLNLAVTVVFLGLIVVVWRRLPFSYTAYSLAILTYISLFLADSPTEAATGNGRYMLMLFPAFILLGQWGERRWFHHTLLIIMLPLLGLFTAHFLLGFFAGA